MTHKPKKKNPQDLTLRNLRAIHKKLENLEWMCVNNEVWLEETHKSINNIHDFLSGQYPEFYFQTKKKKK